MDKEPRQPVRNNKFLNVARDGEASHLVKRFYEFNTNTAVC